MQEPREIWKVTPYTMKFTKSSLWKWKRNVYQEMENDGEDILISYFISTFPFLLPLCCSSKIHYFKEKWWLYTSSMNKTVCQNTYWEMRKRQPGENFELESFHWEPLVIPFLALISKCLFSKENLYAISYCPPPITKK